MDRIIDEFGERAIKSFVAKPKIAQFNELLTSLKKSITEVISETPNKVKKTETKISSPLNTTNLSNYEPSILKFEKGNISMLTPQQKAELQSFEDFISGKGFKEDELLRRGERFLNPPRPEWILVKKELATDRVKQIVGRLFKEGSAFLSEIDNVFKNARIVEFDSVGNLTPHSIFLDQEIAEIRKILININKKFSFPKSDSKHKLCLAISPKGEVVMSDESPYQSGLTDTIYTFFDKDCNRIKNIHKRAADEWINMIESIEFPDTPLLTKQTTLSFEHTYPKCDVYSNNMVASIEHSPDGYKIACNVKGLKDETSVSLAKAIK